MKTIDPNKFFLLVMMMVSLMLASMAAKAETGFEASCRAKAKDTAVQSYQTCLSDKDSRSAQVKEIRDEYKAKMSDLKAEFDQRLKELGAGASTAKTAKAGKKPSAKVARDPKPELPVVGVAKKLPPKRNKNGPALPVQNVTEDQPVVAASEEPPVVPVEDTPAPAAEPVDDSGF